MGKYFTPFVLSGRSGNFRFINLLDNGLSRFGELKVPTLMLGGKYDTMDPTYMEWMSNQVQKGRSVTTNGSDISQYDDADGYFSGLIKFIKDIDEGNFN